MGFIDIHSLFGLDWFVFLSLKNANKQKVILALPLCIFALFLSKGEDILNSRIKVWLTQFPDVLFPT